MRRCLVDNLVRLSSGVGLLLLVAAHEGLFPSLDRPMRCVVKCDADVDADDSTSKKTETPPPTISASLPDFYVSRSAPSQSETTLFEFTRRDVGEASGCDWRSTSPPSSSPVLAAVIVRLTIADALLETCRPSVATQTTDDAARDPAVGSSITHHGPPLLAVRA